MFIAVKASDELFLTTDIQALKQATAPKSYSVTTELPKSTTTLVAPNKGYHSDLFLSNGILKYALSLAPTSINYMSFSKQQLYTYLVIEPNLIKQV